jgi:hypothetical protein
MRRTNNNSKKRRLNKTQILRTEHSHERQCKPKQRMTQNSGQKTMNKEVTKTQD